MQHQRQGRGSGLNGPQTRPVHLGPGFRHQMRIADRHGQRIHPGFCGKLRHLPGIGAQRRRPAVIADKAQFPLDRNAARMGHGHHLGGPGDVLGQGQARSVIHHRGKAAVDGGAADLQPLAVIQMRHHRNPGTVGQMAEHRPQHGQWSMGAGPRSGLQDHRAALGLGGLNIGLRVLPPQHHQPRHGGAVGQTGCQHVAQGGKGHLNFAIMSLMPGIVSIWSACSGWKYCTSGRWVRPPRMVK